MTDPELRSALVSDARHRASRKREAVAEAVGLRRVTLLEEALLLETMADVLEGEGVPQGSAQRQDEKWMAALDEIAGMPLCYDPASGHSRPRGPTVREWVGGLRAEIAALDTERRAALAQVALLSGNPPVSYECRPEDGGVERVEAVPLSARARALALRLRDALARRDEIQRRR